MYRRSVLAVLAGLGVGGGIIMGVEGLGSALFPLPPGVDARHFESVQAWMAGGGVPARALVLVLAGWAIGTVAAAWIAVRIAKRAPLRHAAIVGAAFMAAAAANMILLPHTVWFWIAALAIFPLSTWLGVRIATRNAPRPGPALSRM